MASAHKSLGRQADRAHKVSGFGPSEEWRGLHLSKERPMTDEELMQKAERQERAKSQLLLATAEAVVELMAQDGHMPAKLRFVRELIDELKDASRV